MRIRTTLLFFVIVFVTSGPFAELVSPDPLRKDKAALMLYGGFVDSPILINHADTASMVDIALLRIRGAPVPVSQLAARPCVGLALFTKEGWAALRQRAVPSQTVQPEMAQVRFRLYPAFKGDSAVVYEPPASESTSESDGSGISGGTAWIASAAPRLASTSIPVQAPPGAVGPCDMTS